MCLTERLLVGDHCEFQWHVLFAGCELRGNVRSQRECKRKKARGRGEQAGSAVVFLICRIIKVTRQWKEFGKYTSRIKRY